jgi:hypothetical protein
VISWCPLPKKCRAFLPAYLLRDRPALAVPDKLRSLKHALEERMRQMIAEKKVHEVEMLKTTKEGGERALQSEISALRVSN